MSHVKGIPVSSSNVSRVRSGVVGIVGGGQLARMTAPAAIALGVELRVLALSVDESAAQVIPDVRLGAHDDLQALLTFAEGCDVVTFDHEHVPAAYLEAIERTGVAVRPGPKALVHAQEKALMREALSAAGLPVPQWRVVDDVDQLVGFADGVGWPIILKTSRGGYDGRGVWVLRSPDDASDVMSGSVLSTGAVGLADERVDFTQEIAAQVARSPHGQAVAYPIVRTVQSDGMCADVVAPCPDLSEERAIEAQEIALRIAELLDVTGMLAVEMFDTPAGLIINELAMRPHNSGHWSIDGAVTSQFENHLRAVLDLPLGAPDLLAPYAVMVNIVGQDVNGLPPLHTALRHVLARDPGLRVHLYGKEIRPRRKLGHVTIVGDDVQVLLERAHHAADYLSGAIDE